MSEFKPGDVVVCVDDSPCRHTPYPGAPFSFGRVGSVGRVSVVHTNCIEPGLEFPGKPGDQLRGYVASRFRHLPKADPAFTEAMRALRPEKEGVA